MALILILLAAVVMCIVVSGVYVFIIGFVRKKDVAWLIEDEMRKSPFGKYYDLVLKADLWLKQHTARGITIESLDGLRLHGLWVPAERPRGTILLAHGYRSSYLVDFGPAFEHYHNMGLNLLIPDQRAHGESQGKLITFGVKESDDMLQWLEYHNTHLGNWPIVLSGLSMGASTVIYMLTKTLPGNVKGIIADCGFTSPGAILAAVFKRVTHLPAKPALLITDLLTRVLAGFSIWQCDSQEILSKSSVPILMIHGTKDAFVPCNMTKLAYKACISKKDVLLVDGADHGVSFLVDQERYISHVQSFIKNTLGIYPRKD